MTFKEELKQLFPFATPEQIEILLEEAEKAKRKYDAI
jgi:hypothetical protein